ncbi:MAG: hypothetical protein ABSA11_08180 [Candidatus Bathyarchaeia archaeon]|jgi:hypothetical protein
MVDLGEIQAAYYMVAATGVLVAAAFYIVNLRETTKNRKATFSLALMTTTFGREGARDYAELLSMQWTDADDFKRKYDSRVNPENYILREHFFDLCNEIGWQYRTGLVDLETVWRVGLGVHLMWFKFKPIVEVYRREEWGMIYLHDWEYLAEKIDGVLSSEDKQRRVTHPGQIGILRSSET